MKPMIEFAKFQVDIKKIIDRKDWVRYLTLVNWHMREHFDALKVAADAGFQKYVTEQLDAYLSGKEPEPAITGAIMNLADQVMSGEAITLRAGDYIALQSQYRQTRPA